MAEPEVMLDTFDVHSIPITILFYSGASHSFISQIFVKTHSIPLCAMKNPILVNSLGGSMQASYQCLPISLILRGVEFKVSPIVLRTAGIDLILGRDRISVEIVVQKQQTATVNRLDDNVNQEDPVVDEFPDVFPDDLPRMPPDRDIEFIIELLPRTAPIAKHPYTMGVNELEELKKQIKEFQEKGFIRPSSSP
jgi:hypothetical protein